MPMKSEKKGHRSDKGQTMIEDMDREYLTIEVIDIYGGILNKKYGPDNYVMRSDLRDLHDNEVNGSKKRQIDGANSTSDQRIDDRFYRRNRRQDPDDR